MPAATNDATNNNDTELTLLKLELFSRKDLPYIDVMQAWLSDDIEAIRQLLQRSNPAVNSARAGTTHRPPPQPQTHNDQQVTQEQQVRDNAMRQLQRSWQPPEASHVAPAQPKLNDDKNNNAGQGMQDKCCGIM